MVKLGLVWVFKMPFNLVVVGVLGDSARLQPSVFAEKVFLPNFTLCG